MSKAPIIATWMICFLLLACSENGDNTNGTQSKAMFPYFERISTFSRYRFQAGYMDIHGNRVLDNDYVSAEPFTEELGCVAITKNGKVVYGYIDPYGKFAIKPHYKKARPFHEGRALVCNDSNDWFVIDRSGKSITKAIYSPLTSDYKNGYCIAYQWKETRDEGGFLGINNSISYYDCYRIDLNGKQTLIASETSRTDYSDSINTAMMNFIGPYWERDAKGKTMYGYKKISVDDYEQAVFSECGNYVRKGDILIKAKYKDARCFYNGFARVKFISGKSAYIDTLGKVLFTFEDDY